MNRQDAIAEYKKITKAQNSYPDDQRKHPEYRKLEERRKALLLIHLGIDKE